MYVRIVLIEENDILGDSCQLNMDGYLALHRIVKHGHEPICRAKNEEEQKNQKLPVECPEQEVSDNRHDVW